MIKSSPVTIVASPKRPSMAGATIIVMAASAVSAVLGFGREIVSAHYYGTHAAMDAFLNASTIPIVVFGIFNAAIVYALVPTFSEYTSAGRVDELRRLGSTVINGLFCIMTVLAGLGWLFAPQFVSAIAHGFSPQEQQLEVVMVRWLMPGIIATSCGGVCAALLNANHRFLEPSLISVASNAVTIVFVITLHRSLGIFALVLGSVIGLFAQLLVQLPSMLRDGLYRFELDLRHPGLAKACALLLPVAVGSGASQINLAFDRFFASTLDAGSTSGLNYTTKVTALPISIFAGAISTVIFPLIARQFARTDRMAMQQSISQSLRMIGFIVIPCATVLSVLAHPIIQTLFERGAFGSTATTFCSGLIPFACVPLVALSYNIVVARACYACKEVRYAVIASVVSMSINIALSAILLHVLAARGLLLANGVAAIFGTAFLLVVLSRLVGGLPWKPLLSSLFLVSVASVVTGALLNQLLPLRSFAVTENGIASEATHLAVLLCIAGTCYLLIARMLRIQELGLVWETALTRFSRGRSATTDQAERERTIV